MAISTISSRSCINDYQWSVIQTVTNVVSNRIAHYFQQLPSSLVSTGFYGNYYTKIFN
jgi:hypothetical protein